MLREREREDKRALDTFLDNARKEREKRLKLHGKVQ